MGWMILPWLIVWVLGMFGMFYTELIIKIYQEDNGYKARNPLLVLVRSFFWPLVMTYQCCYNGVTYLELLFKDEEENDDDNNEDNNDTYH